MVLVALLLGACATARQTGRVTSDDPATGGIHVSIHADDDDRAVGADYPEPVRSVLERRVEGVWLPVFTSLESRWAVAGLEPGRYRVRMDTRLDPTGRAVPLDHPVVERVRVQAGEVVHVEVLLDQVSPVVVAAGAAAVVVAAVLLHEWLGDLDLPEPPRPPAWALDAAFWVTVDWATEPHSWIPRDRAPQVTSHFPRDGDLVDTRHPQIVFVLSEPIDPTRGVEDAVRVELVDGGEIPGRTVWHEETWWLTWEPEDELPPGAQLRATLLPETVVDRVGAPIGRAVSFEFETAEDDSEHGAEL